MSFSVNINSLSKRTENNEAVIIDFNNETLKFFNDKKSAIKFAKDYRSKLSKTDTLYVVYKNHRSIYFVTSAKDGRCG